MAGEVLGPAVHVFAGAHFETVEVPMPDVAERAAIWRRQLNGRAPRWQIGPKTLASDSCLPPRGSVTQSPLPNRKAAADQEPRRRAPRIWRRPAGASPTRTSATSRSRWTLVTAGTTWSCPSDRPRSCARSAAQVAPPPPGVRATGGSAASCAHGTGAQRAVRRPAGHRQDHGRRGHRRRARARPVQDRPVGRGQQVHRRDREEPATHLRARPSTATPSCSSTRPTRCSASAPRCRDAHDRYANIETSYLLQRMERLRGRRRSSPPTCGRTSTRRSSAGSGSSSSSRSPTRPAARGSGRRTFPQPAPVADDVDSTVCRARFPASPGGNIRNIVLNAAFLAAADGDVTSPTPPADIRRGTSGPAKVSEKLVGQAVLSYVGHRMRQPRPGAVWRGAP